MLLLALLLLVIILCFLAMSIAGMLSFPRIAEAIRQGRLTRAAVYRSQIVGLWLLAALVLLPAVFGLYGFSDLGLLWFRPGPAWLAIPAAVVAGFYFLCLVITILFARGNHRQGKPPVQKVPEQLRPLFPATAGDRRLWVWVALTAGFAEEVLFRGFIMYGLAVLFPGLHVVAVLLVSTVLFGLGHMYQGPKEALQPMALGLLFGVFYLAFGTIWPCVVLHALQDLCVLYAAGEEK